MEKEIWRTIEGYKGLYEISSLGNVRSLNYRHTGRTQLLKPTMERLGYLQVGLSKNGKRKRYKVHRLVAQAFLTKTEGLPEVNHIDENKQNNCVDNLEWCDRSYNVNYGTGIARRAAAQTNGKCSKPVQQLSLDGSLIAVWPSMSEAQRVTGVNLGHIWGCCKGKRHSTGGYGWKYA